jgi:hypothetical protein
MGDLRGGRWHADPTGRWELRYWDGRRWTERVQRRGYPGVDPIADPHAAYPTGAPVPGLRSPSERERRPRRRIATRVDALPVWARVTVAAVIVMILAWPFVSGDGEPQRTVSADGPRTTEPTTTTAPPTTAPPSTTTSTTTTTAPPPTTAAPPPPPPTTSRPPTTAAPTTTAPPPPPTTAQPPPDPACDPNYSGCVPVASDVDCAGRGHDGPAFVDGPVWVIGDDIYHLDRNGDGVGCGYR